MEDKMEMVKQWLAKHPDEDDQDLYAQMMMKMMIALLTEEQLAAVLN